MTMQSTDNWESVKAKAEAALSPAIVQRIKEFREGPHSDSQLIAALHLVQDEFGYLSAERLDAVAQLLRVPTAKVTGVATFYHFFRLQPPGRFTIRVCLGTACYVKGADRLAAKLQEELGIGYGETTKDGLFTLEGTRCLGTCGQAPVLMVDEAVHGYVTPDKIPSILEHYTQLAKQSTGE